MSALDLPDLATALGRNGNGLDGLAPATLATRLPGDGGDWLNQILALDFTTYMPGSVLTKVDRASMAHGLEVRPPLLDNQVVDWAFSLSSRYKLRGTARASICSSGPRRAASPTRSSTAPRKASRSRSRAGCAGRCGRASTTLVASSPVWDMGVLDQPTFATWNREHHEHQRDRSKPLWALLVLDHWVRRRPSFYRRGGGSQVERTNAAARASAGLGPRP